MTPPSIDADAAPRERGILFSKPMVRALLAGTKTQTRRALPFPPADDGLAFEAWHAAQEAVLQRRFGVPGERLWVRERFVAFGRWQVRFDAGEGRHVWSFADMTLAGGHGWRFDGADPAARRDADAAPTWHPRPALFMPRAASRILLDVVGVRIERLHGISVDDAVAEGIVRVGDGFEVVDDAGRAAGTTMEPVRAYRSVWEGINGAASWGANPWVAVVAFRRSGSDGMVPPTGIEPVSHA